MKLHRTLTTLIFGLALAVGSQTIFESQADAKPFGTLTQSRKSGKRTHKKSDGDSSSSNKKKSSSSSSGDRRVVRRTTTTSRPSGTTYRTNRTSGTYRRPASSSSSVSRHGSSTRTVRNTRPRSTTHSSHGHTTHTRTVRTSSGRRLRGNTSRRTYYRSGSRRTYHSGHHSHHHSSHAHASVHHSSSGRASNVRREDSKPSVEAYVTGGLGISGFASNEITDLALPGAGYNLAVGAKGGFFGGEIGLNGGGYTFEPGSGSADIALVGLSGDLKLQPSIGFFEPYVAAGLGGYAMNDAVIEESATGMGLRLGAGADFRFGQVALRVNYQHNFYGMQDVNGGYDGDLSARTETLGANLVVYF